VTELISTDESNEHSGGRQEKTVRRPTGEWLGNHDPVVSLCRVPQDDEIDEEVPPSGIGQRLTQNLRLKRFAVKEIGNDFVVGIHRGALVLPDGRMRSCRSALMGAASTARNSSRVR
jgi:hypothetical protein